ncbi:E2/UBC family protein [Klebsiella pneumoniae]|uniref:E2/UBC family protein n=1 Tax=Klebsiella pneumoniae TaxID=573 RepID=UPI0036D2888D
MMSSICARRDRKLRLTPKDVNNGEESPAKRRGFSLLPSDERHLNEMGYFWETSLNGNARWPIIHGFEVPEGYNHQQVNLALSITSGLSRKHVGYVLSIHHWLGSMASTFRLRKLRRLLIVLRISDGLAIAQGS